MRATEWHVRFNVTSTVKDGFRVGELTVSADFDEGNEPTPDQFRSKVNDAFAVADGFCQERNADRGQVVRNGLSITNSATGAHE